MLLILVILSMKYLEPQLENVLGMKLGDQPRHQYVNQVNKNLMSLLFSKKISIFNIKYTLRTKFYSVYCLFIPAETCPVYPDKYPGLYQPIISYDQAPLDDGFPIGTVATLTCADNEEYYLLRFSNTSTCYFRNTTESSLECTWSILCKK